MILGDANRYLRMIDGECPFNKRRHTGENKQKFSIWMPTFAGMTTWFSRFFFPRYAPLAYHAL